MPKANDHPQFSIWCLLAIEKMISESPPNKNDNPKNMDKARSELVGDTKATMLTITKNKPTINGMYQFLTASLIDFKIKVSILLFF